MALYSANDSSVMPIFLIANFEYVRKKRGRLKNLLPKTKIARILFKKVENFFRSQWCLATSNFRFHSGNDNKTVQSFQYSLFFCMNLNLVLEI